MNSTRLRASVVPAAWVEVLQLRSSLALVAQATQGVLKAITNASELTPGLRATVSEGWTRLSIACTDVSKQVSSLEAILGLHGDEVPSKGSNPIADPRVTMTSIRDRLSTEVSALLALDRVIDAQTATRSDVVIALIAAKTLESIEREVLAVDEMLEEIRSMLPASIHDATGAIKAEVGTSESERQPPSAKDVVEFFDNTWDGMGYLVCFNRYHIYSISPSDPTPTWELIVPLSPHWDALHQRVYRQLRADRIEASDLPPGLPVPPRCAPVGVQSYQPPPDPVYLATSVPNLFYYLRHADSSAGSMRAWLVLYEDRYESMLGDGKFHYPLDIFLTRRDAEEFVEECLREQKKKPNEMGYAYHLRTLRIQLSGEMLEFPEMDRRLFDHFGPSDIAPQLEKRLVEYFKGPLDPDLDGLNKAHSTDQAKASTAEPCSAISVPGALTNGPEKNPLAGLDAATSPVPALPVPGNGAHSLAPRMLPPLDVTPVSVAKRGRAIIVLRFILAFPLAYVAGGMIVGVLEAGSWLSYLGALLPAAVAGIFALALVWIARAVALLFLMSVWVFPDR